MTTISTGINTATGTMELHRVHSVQQTAMSATSLPLELQQQVFSFLDTRSFYAARNVCRYWRFASLDALTLEKQLRKLPVLPTPNAKQSSPAQLMKLFDEAAQILLLGMQVRRQPDEPGSMKTAFQHGFFAGPRVCATSNGSRMVTLNDRKIALYDTSNSPSTLISQRTINDLKETVGNGPWLKVSPPASHDLALSSDGRLLAIAQERTIQIYDLLADPDSFSVNEYISSASGHYICGLDFEQNNHVLRVQLSGRGTVLYCGTPPADNESAKSAGLEHWKSKGGLKHTFLDSHIMTLSENDAGRDRTARLSGLQLLRTFQSGWLFGAQRHGGGESSHYVLGHIRASTPHNTTALKIEPGSVTILARLESFLSSWDYTLNCSAGSDSSLGVWENMPSAHEHHPSFALSPDGSTLVVAEKDKKRVRPSPISQLFLYRLPSSESMAETLLSQTRQRQGKWASLASFLDRLESQQQGPRRRRISMKHDDFESSPLDRGIPGDHRKGKKEYKIGRVPLCLGTTQGVLTSMRFEDALPDGAEGKRQVLSVSTAEATRSWDLLDL